MLRRAACAPALGFGVWGYEGICVAGPPAGMYEGIVLLINGGINEGIYEGLWRCLRCCVAAPAAKRYRATVLVSTSGCEGEATAPLARQRATNTANRPPQGPFVTDYKRCRAAQL